MRLAHGNAEPVKIRLSKNSGFVRCGVLLLLLSGAAWCLRAQSSAQSTVSTPADPPPVFTDVVTEEVRAPAPPTVTRTAPTVAVPAQPTTSSPHLIARTGPPIEEVNRQALEENAGRNAANILMRSSPSGALIYINGAFVGHTPLLLNVAPGKYKIEMRGERDDLAERTVGLLPNDTQKVTLILGSRYPSRVSIR
jgi:PEGA domain